jgi:orotidine-5'-phosphate decarboxylase
MEYAVAYKPNLAFYEAMGIKGLISLEKTMKYIDGRVFTIADAKRGDIGNTAEKYAQAFYDYYNFDSITVAPYMGEDSITPFLKFKDKTTIVLGLTSNPGAKDFQFLETKNGLLYEEVIKKIAALGNEDQLMFVVGATRPEQIANIRTLIPKHFLLVPGVGAQGGDLDGICKNGLVKETAGLLINASRAIQYASSGKDFEYAAAKVAQDLQKQMAFYLT